MRTKVYNYTKKSTLIIKPISFTGNPTDCNTINIATIPAPGMLLSPTEATEAVRLIIKT